MLDGVARFNIVLHSVTQCYIVLQCVIVLHGVTLCYTVFIQSVTGCYIVLHGVT